MAGSSPSTHIVSVHIVSVLEHGFREIPSDGTVQMPVWGPVVGSMERSAPTNRLCRISNLSHYVETM